MQTRWLLCARLHAMNVQAPTEAAEPHTFSGPLAPPRFSAMPKA